MMQTAPKQNYLTDAGRKKLTAQLDYYENMLRPNILDKLESASDGGDSIENTELILTLQELDMRIAFVKDTLRDSDPIVRDPATADIVTLGCTVTLELKDDRIATYTIVGSAESDPENGSISNRSPLEVALMGKRTNDHVTVTNRDFSYQVRILQIV